MTDAEKLNLAIKALQNISGGWDDMFPYDKDIHAHMSCGYDACSCAEDYATKTLEKLGA